MDLLIEEAAQTHGIEAEPTLLGTVVGVQVKLRGGVTVHVAVQAGHAEARLGRLAVIRGIELLLRERRQQHPEPVELHRRQEILEEPVVVVDRHDLAARHVAELGPILQEDGGRKLRQERFGEIELHVEALEPREHASLDLREHLAAGDVLGVRKRRVGEDATPLDLVGAEPGQIVPGES